MVSMKKMYLVLIALAVLLLSCCLPAGAVLQTFTYRGYVTSVTPETGNLSLVATHRWGCSYENNTTTCGWRPVTPQPLAGTVPTDEVFTVIHSGTMVEATSIGIPGGSWTGIGLLVPVYETGGWYATDLFGDIASLPAPLISYYSVSATTTPDCINCTGSRCPADSATVSIFRGGGLQWNGTLLAGQAHRYEDIKDHSAVSVRFIRGQASSGLCPNGSGGMGGIQPVSIFVVHVDPPASGPIPTPQTSTGTLAVTSMPSGGIVYLDGRMTGLTPFSRSGLSPREYALRIEKEGYTAWEKNVTIIPGHYSTWTARLEPLYGSLSIRSYPLNASISLDGSPKGFTPLILTGIPSGMHVVELSKPGYTTIGSTARVTGGGIELVYLELPPVTTGPG
jgi:hypothetical protein